MRLLLQEQALGQRWTTSPCGEMGMAPAAQKWQQIPEALGGKNL